MTYIEAIKLLHKNGIIDCVTMSKKQPHTNVNNDKNKQRFYFIVLTDETQLHIFLKDDTSEVFQVNIDRRDGDNSVREIFNATELKRMTFDNELEAVLE